MSHTPLTHTQAGSGPALVFLHGFCESKDVWTEFVQPLTSQFRVITLDLPGHGQSAVPQDFSMESQAEQVKQTLEALNVRKSLVVGHSMGGYVALALAEKYPHLLRGLCLFHSTAFPDSAEKQEGRKKSAEFIQRHGLDKFMDSFVAPMFAPANRDTCQGAIEKMQAIGKATPVETVLGCLQAMRERKDRINVLQEASFPVLFMVGKEDPAVPLEASLQQCHLPENSMTYFMSQVGHMGMWERPHQTRQALVKFAETLPG